MKTHGVEVDQATIDRAPDFIFHHIGDSDKPIKLATTGYAISRTDSPEDCPNLDALLIGGPFPEEVRRAAGSANVYLVTFLTGSCSSHSRPCTSI